MMTEGAGMRERRPIAVAITGASGSAYGLRLVESLLEAGRPVYLMISEAGYQVLELETGLALGGTAEQAQHRLVERLGVGPGRLRVFGPAEWGAPVASGSNAPEAMVVCPCTVGTASALACGASNSLLERAADVILKERRKLILVVRETPLSTIHLENMLRLSRAGAVIMPASPGFYHRPESLDDLVDFMVARVLDHLGVESELSRRWGMPDPS